MHPLIERIEAALAGVVPPEPIAIRGVWSRSTRGEIVDLCWRGVAECAVPLAAIGFLDGYWTRSAPASLNPPIDVALHAYADRRLDRATLAAGFGSAQLQGVAVTGGPDWIGSCALGDGRAESGRAYRVAEIDGVVFVALFLPGSLLKTGRNRLWRLREEIAVQLPDDVREIFTRGRTGTAS